MLQYSKRQKIIRLALIRSGIRCDLVAYDYLAKAVEILIENPVINSSLLFKNLAEDYGCSAVSVEASMKNAIRLAKATRGFGWLKKVYASDFDMQPSVLEFINLVAGYYTLGLYKKLETGE